MARIQSQQDLEDLIWRAWDNFLDTYEENPKTYEPDLILKLSNDLCNATSYETDMVCFINRKKNDVHRIEFNGTGRPQNIEQIASTYFAA